MMTRIVTPLRCCLLCAALILPGLPAMATEPSGTERPIRLPSGAEVQWLETLHDSSGGTGLTYRFRFLMKDLSARVPSTTGPASEPDMDGGRAPIEIDTETAEVTGATDGEEYIDDGMIDPHTLDLSPVPADDATEAAADEMIDDPALPSAPDALMQDPLHDDVMWLCQNWILPRVAKSGPRPTEIMISIADKDIPFGSYDPEVLQLFDAFRLPPDRDECDWEPW